MLEAYNVGGLLCWRLILLEAYSFRGLWCWRLSNTRGPSSVRHGGGKAYSVGGLQCPCLVRAYG